MWKIELVRLMLWRHWSSSRSSGVLWNKQAHETIRKGQILLTIGERNFSTG